MTKWHPSMKKEQPKGREQSLSDKIHQHPYEYDEESTYINETDVKDFIKKLKEEIKVYKKMSKRTVLRLIDKIFGPKLVEGGKN